MKVLETAQRSSSYKNSQPWEAVFVSGKKKEELTAMLTELFEKVIPPSPDSPEPAEWPPSIGLRIEALFKKRAEPTGIDLNAPDVRRKSKLVNFGFNGAPRGIFIFQRVELDE